MIQYFGHLTPRANSLEKTLMMGKIEGKRRRGQGMRWLDSITNSMGMNLSNLRDSKGQGRLACRQEYWSGLPFPSPGDLPNTGTEPGFPELQAALH